MENNVSGILGHELFLSYKESLHELGEHTHTGSEIVLQAGSDLGDEERVCIEEVRSIRAPGFYDAELDEVLQVLGLNLEDSTGLF